MVTAANPESSIRLFIWMSFLASAVVCAALVVTLNAGVPSTEMSWSVQATGLLEVEGKPTVDVSTTHDGDLVIAIATKNGHQVHRAPLRLARSKGDHTSIGPDSLRTFWRGNRLIIDNGQGNVVSIDPTTALVRPVPVLFGWGSGIGQFAGVAGVAGGK